MAKKKEMNRTSGVAKRKAPNMSQSERIGRQRQAAAAETGPRDKFNPAAAQGVVDTLGFGVNSSGKFEFNPIATLGMALPVGKVLKVGQALKAAGKFGLANQFLGRVAAKKAGQEFGKDLAIAATSKAAGAVPKTLREGSRIGGKIFKGRTSRMTSEIDAFPRLPKGNLPPGEKPTFDVLADPFGEGNWRSADRIQPVKNALKTGFTKFSKSVPTKSGINEIKQATAKRGIKVTEQGASRMARLLQERAKRKGK